MVLSAAQVSRVQRLEQIERFGTAHLADQDAVGAMAQRGAQQVCDRDGRDWSPGPMGLVPAGLPVAATFGFSR